MALIRYFSANMQQYLTMNETTEKFHDSTPLTLLRQHNTPLAIYICLSKAILSMNLQGSSIDICNATLVNQDQPIHTNNTDLLFRIY